MAASVKEFSLEPFSSSYSKNAGCGYDSNIISCILCTVDRSVLIWDQYNSCIHSFPAEILSVKDQTSDQPTRRKEENYNKTQNQKYLCVTPPDFEVAHVLPNPCSSHIALVGKNDISILELPPKISKGKESGQLCKIFALDQRFFQTHRKCMILKAIWHPASPNGSHISLLLSNNTIRTYSIHTARVPHHVFSLSETSSQFSTALGESFISMDFGLPEVDQQGDAVVYPLFLLNHTGDVYKTQLHLSVKLQNMLESPLPMRPAAEDNYGFDACDITFLTRHGANGTCQVLAIATAGGTIYHCVLLPESIRDYNAATHSLYLYDRVEVAFVLVAPDQDRGNMVDFEISSQIRLINAGDGHNTYFCMHSMGIHSVKLGWMDNLVTIDDDELDSRVDLDLDCAQVSHVLCTQPTQDSKLSPIRGIAVIPDLLDCRDTLFCVLNDFTCAVIKLRDHVIEVKPMVSQLSDGEIGPVSEHKPFIHTIQQLLERNSNNPLIRTGPEQQQDMESNFQLISSSTQICRDEYLSKLSEAKDTLDRRVNFLSNMKEEQLLALQQLKNDKIKLKDEAEQLAERYEDLKDQNKLLVSRIEWVMSRIQLATDTQSKAEAEFKGELNERQSDLEQLEEFLEQVKRKIKFHKESKEETLAPGFSLSHPQLKTINFLLNQESNDLASLVQQVKDVRVITGGVEHD